LWGIVCAVGAALLLALGFVLASAGRDWPAGAVCTVLAGGLSYALWRHHVIVREAWVEVGEDGVRVRDRHGDESVAGWREIRELRVERLRWSLGMTGYCLAVATAAGAALKVGPDVERLRELVNQIAKRAGLTDTRQVWLATVYSKPAPS
jgi:hypothetical protein